MAMSKLKTGIELIADERKEQIEKHGYTEKYTKEHPEYYDNYQLADAGRRLIFTPSQEGLSVMGEDLFLPKGWNKDYWKYVLQKSYQNRLIIAGALIAAEI
jgi:hypothetical protein